MKKGRVWMNRSSHCRSTLLASKTQGGTRKQEAGFLPAGALPHSSMLFELGSVHLSPQCPLASNGLESTLNKSLIQPHYIVASATTNTEVRGVAAFWEVAMRIIVRSHG